MGTYQLWSIFQKGLCQAKWKKTQYFYKKYKREYKHLRPEVQAILILPFRSDN